jgi:hypothetical protein
MPTTLPCDLVESFDGARCGEARLVGMDADEEELVSDPEGQVFQERRLESGLEPPELAPALEP